MVFEEAWHHLVGHSGGNVENELAGLRPGM